jgi:hypothetical protein
LRGAERTRAAPKPRPQRSGAPDLFAQPAPLNRGIRFAPHPACFLARAGLAARTRWSKRRKGVAKALPVLTGALGKHFLEQFNAFAASTPPSAGGPAADDFAFARWLDASGLFPPAAAGEFLGRFLWHGRRIGLSARRGDRGLLVGVRLPLFGVRLICVPDFSRSLRAARR